MNWQRGATGSSVGEDEGLETRTGVKGDTVNGSTGRETKLGAGLSCRLNPQGHLQLFSGELRASVHATLA